MEKLEKYIDISPEQIRDWKARYGANSLSEATVSTDEGEYRFVLRKPGRNVLEAIASTKENVEAANKLLIGNCVLGGDTYVFEQDGSVYLSVLEEVSKLMGKAKASVKKL